MHDTKERLSQLWLFALLNYLYADVLALFDIVGSQDPAPHLPPWALLGSAVLMEIPIAQWGQCEKRTPNTDRPGDRGAAESAPNLFSIYGSAAFQLEIGR